MCASHAARALLAHIHRSNQIKHALACDAHGAVIKKETFSPASTCSWKDVNSRRPRASRVKKTPVARVFLCTLCSILAMTKNCRLRFVLSLFLVAVSATFTEGVRKTPRSRSIGLHVERQHAIIQSEVREAKACSRACKICGNADAFQREEGLSSSAQFAAVAECEAKFSREMMTKALSPGCQYYQSNKGVGYLDVADSDIEAFSIAAAECQTCSLVSIEQHWSPKMTVADMKRSIANAENPLLLKALAKWRTAGPMPATLDARLNWKILRFWAERHKAYLLASDMSTLNMHSLEEVESVWKERLLEQAEFHLKNLKMDTKTIYANAIFNETDRRQKECQEMQRKVTATSRAQKLSYREYHKQRTLSSKIPVLINSILSIDNALFSARSSLAAAYNLRKIRNLALQTSKLQEEATDLMYQTYKTGKSSSDVSVVGEEVFNLQLSVRERQKEHDMLIAEVSAAKLQLVRLIRQLIEKISARQRSVGCSADELLVDPQLLAAQ